MGRRRFFAIAAVIAVLVFAPSALAVDKSWNGEYDYYSWGTVGEGGVRLSDLGDNPTEPGVHGNYTTTTAKCKICHAVHRANPNGVKLLDTNVATCAGCHRAGATTVTSVVVTWESGGPHNSGDSLACNDIGCHLPNPHGAGGSQYKIFAAKLINNVTTSEDGAKADIAVADALDSPSSGITLADLNAEATSTWDALKRRIVVTGYTCNSSGCHDQSMLPVINKGYSEERVSTYPGGPKVGKTGHVSAGVADAIHASFVPVESCTSCHEQQDTATRTGYTFPHSQTAFGGTNLQGGPRAYLWMGYAGSKGATLTALGEGDKALDGVCLKCHRDDGDSAGIGITQ